MPERTPLPAGTIGTEPGPLMPRADQDKDPATAGTAGSDRTVPPMPSEVTNVRARRPGAGRWLRRAMMRRGPRQP